MTPPTSVFLPAVEMGQLDGFWIALVRMAKEGLYLLLFIVDKFKISRKQ